MARGTRRPRGRRAHHRRTVRKHAARSPCLVLLVKAFALAVALPTLGVMLLPYHL